RWTGELPNAWSMRWPVRPSAPAAVHAGAGRRARLVRVPVRRLASAALGGRGHSVRPRRLERFPELPEPARLQRLRLHREAQLLGADEPDRRLAVAAARTGSR